MKTDWRKRLGVILLDLVLKSKKVEKYPIGQAEKRVSNLFSQELKKARLDGFKKGYFKGVLDSEWGQITSEELSKK